ncbi:MAG: hypothetical protein JW395_1895 [Nitrospira sp.]|nr:hypothetical protein [Nitrospira sp.]
MNREQTDELFHALVHRCVERSVWRQVSTDLLLLREGLFQQALCYHIFHIGPRDDDLFEAIFDPAKGIGYEGEARALEEQLLDSADEAES